MCSARLLLFVVSLILSMSSAFSYPQICNINNSRAIDDEHRVFNALPARVQWNANDGYCGETSLISAGLYYGQYVSQFDARVLANINFSPKDMQFYQILIGVPGHKTRNNNMELAAINMHLHYTMFNNYPFAKRTTKEFMLWVKNMVIRHYPTIIGVYENYSVFQQNDADQEYDHIVPVFGITSFSSLKKRPQVYDHTDVIYFHDNSLFGGGNYYPNCFRYRMGFFQKTRGAANQINAGIYSVSNNRNQQGNYGIAILGVKGKGLYPVRLTTDPTYELPSIMNGSNKRPQRMQLKLGIEVSKLKPQTPYLLLKYAKFSDLPAADDFTKSYGHPQASCTILLDSGSQFKGSKVIWSDQTVIYRVVKATTFNDLPPDC